MPATRCPAAARVVATGHPLPQPMSTIAAPAGRVAAHSRTTSMPMSERAAMKRSAIAS
nr:hypothetical protein [Sphingomonas sp. Leaf5]